jgi:hypothetical protein
LDSGGSSNVELGVSLTSISLGGTVLRQPHAW